MVRPLRLRIGSRGSQLALWQTEHVRRLLTDAAPELEIEVEIIRTTGDRILDVPLAKIGDRGLFTKELDEALLDGRADLAVHSMKDVPTRTPDGLAVIVFGAREDPRDVLVGPRGVGIGLATLPAGARVGTSSLRRRAQLRAVRPDVEVVDLRGNLNTRFSRLDAGDYDAIILAAAGVRRLEWTDRISEALDPGHWIPAVAQGALAVVHRSDDDRVADLLRAFRDPATETCVTAERAFMRALEGGCQIPIGALAGVEGDQVTIDGFVSDTEGSSMLRERISGPATDPATAGAALAERLLERGAAEVLARVREQGATPGVPAP